MNVKRYVRKNVRRYVRRYVRKNAKRYVRNNFSASSGLLSKRLFYWSVPRLVEGWLEKAKSKPKLLRRGLAGGWRWGRGRVPRRAQECQKTCQKICQKECQKICQKICQKECLKICQKECQKIVSSQSAKLRVTERISGDQLYVYPHPTRSG